MKQQAEWLVCSEDIHPLPTRLKGQVLGRQWDRCWGGWGLVTLANLVSSRFRERPGLKTQAGRLMSHSSVPYGWSLLTSQCFKQTCISVSLLLRGKFALVLGLALRTTMLLTRKQALSGAASGTWPFPLPLLAFSGVAL